jgi:hypothetical protein
VVCEGGPLYFIDTLNKRPKREDNEFVMDAGEPLRITGWFVIPSTGRAALAMDVLVDGTASPAFYGFDRPDVATHFGDPDYQPSGFEVMVPANELTAGAHTVQFRAIATDRSCYAETTPLSITIR